MSRRSVAVAAVALLGLAACGDDDNGSSQQIVTSTASVDTIATTVPPADGGDVFVDPNGVFSAAFPLEPTETPGTAPVAGGGTVDFVSYIAASNDAAYVVGCIDYAASGLADVVVDLEGARDGALSNIGATLGTSTEIELQGREGLEFTGTMSAGTITGRIFADGPTVMCQVLGLGGEPATTTAFLDSFRFLEAA